MIRVRQVARRFDQTSVLSSVTLDVARGTAVAIGGPPQAGRTTLLRILATLIAPSAGSAEIDGIDVAGRPDAVRRRTIYVDGWLAAADGLTVADYAAFVIGARAQRIPRAAAVGSAVERCGLAPRLRVDSLDADGRARLALGCALACDAAVLLLDEPLRDVAEAARPAFADWMRERCDAGATVLAACGDAAGALVPADRVLALDNGRLTPKLRVAGIA
jgi:ABC-type multidrug transport system ATPase subunit